MNKEVVKSNTGNVVQLHTQNDECKERIGLFKDFYALELEPRESIKALKILHWRLAMHRHSIKYHHSYE